MRRKYIEKTCLLPKAIIEELDKLDLDKIRYGNFVDLILNFNHHILSYDQIENPYSDEFN